MFSSIVIIGTSFKRKTGMATVDHIDIKIGFQDIIVAVFGFNADSGFAGFFGSDRSHINCIHFYRQNTFI